MCTIKCSSKSSLCTGGCNGYLVCTCPGKCEGNWPVEWFGGKSRMPVYRGSNMSQTRCGGSDVCEAEPVPRFLVG